MEHAYSNVERASSSYDYFPFDEKQYMWPKGLLDVDSALDISRVDKDLTPEPGNLAISPSIVAPTNQTNLPTYLLDSWHIPPRSLIDVDAVASELPSGITQWTGIDPSATYLAAPAQSEVPIPSSSVNPAAPWEECAPRFERGQPIYITPSYASGNEMEPLASVYGTEYSAGSIESATHLGFACPEDWGTPGTAWPVPTTMEGFEASPAVTPSLDLSLRRRHHDRETHGNEHPPLESWPLPQKGFKDGESDGALEAALSVNDTLYDSAANVQWDDTTSEAARHGAKTLATLNAQGMHYQPLGPRFQQGWVVTSAQEPPRVEGGMEEEPRRHIESAAQQQVEDNPIPIPKNLSKEHQTLLAATKADWERGTTQGIACRFCLGAKFRTWEGFKRHCDTAEAHPLKIAFCDHCGDFFARSDALERHRNKPPLSCRNARPEMASEKRRGTEKVHKEFIESLGRCTKAGGEVEMHFAQVIKKIYPDSSKKCTRRKGRSPLHGRRSMA